MAIAKPQLIEEWGEAAVKKLSVKEIERELGLDRIKPLPATESDQRELQGKPNPFDDWYEEELRALYEKIKSTSR